MSWEDTLLRAGIELTDASGRADADLTLDTPEGTVHVECKQFNRSPRLRDLLAVLNHEAASTRPVLIVAPTLTRPLQQQLRDAGISYATSDTCSLTLTDRTFEHDTDWEGPEAQPPRPALPDLPWRGRSAFQVLRRLLHHPQLPTQRDLAREAHVSQPRVSQVLTELRRHRLLNSDGQLPPASREVLVRYWLHRYPGPGGIITRWYSPQPLADATAAAVEAAEAIEASPALSSDLAADQFAPWGRPSRARLYVRRMVDLADVGLVRTPDEEATTLELAVADDPTAWPPDPDVASISGRTVRLAEPLQVAWDVARTGDIDAAKKTDRILDRTFGLVPGPA